MRITYKNLLTVIINNSGVLIDVGLSFKAEWRKGGSENNDTEIETDLDQDQLELTSCMQLETDVRGGLICKPPRFFN